MEAGTFGSSKHLRLLHMVLLGFAFSFYAVGFHQTAALLTTLELSLIVNVTSLRFYRTTSATEVLMESSAMAGQLECSPQALGGFSYWRLALVSILALFLELLMIRWVSSEINVFAYFKNFVLIACFLGFGLGCYLSRRRIQFTTMLLPLLALALICDLPWPALRRMVNFLPNVVGASSQVETWGLPSLSPGWFNLLLLAGAMLFVVLVFELIAFIFIPIGQLVGWYLENATDGIFAYTVNILGSLVGIVAYTLICFLTLPPAAWFLLAGIMLAGLLWKLPRLRWASLATFMICSGLALLAAATIGQRLDIEANLGGAKNSTVYWSPYQKLAITPLYDGGELTSYVLTTNDSQHQRIFNLSPAFVQSHPKLFEGAPPQWNNYNMPYQFQSHPDSVLVLGAGTGNDAAAALRNGAGRVVAVEIDPLIAQLGRRLHFEKPYSSPRVQLIVDDARSYLQNSNERFDLIMFSFLDSKINGSYYSNIRIDNYVYTLEAFKAARHLLKPDGLMVVKFYARKLWIAGRLQRLAQAAFGRPPLQLETVPLGGRVFVCGSPERVAQALRNPQLAAYVAQHRNVPVEEAPTTTDDWPYFYQREPGLPASLILVSMVLIMIAFYFLRETGVPVGSMRWHFFFLGAGFMLLETQIVSKMALLFGTTWVVNSVVIAGLLVLIVTANFLVEWWPRISFSAAYLGIVGSILLACIVPLETFFFPSIWIKALAATAVLCLPVFFAGIVFIRSFAGEHFRGEALGSNLMGALVGGLLESLSMWTGMRSLLIIAALLYLASWIALNAQRPQVAKVTADPALKAMAG